MKKIFSVTGRTEIDPAFVTAEILRNHNTLEVSLSWDFSLYSFSSESTLVVDLFVPNTTENRRYQLGKVSSLEGNKVLDLSGMINPLDLKVRFKVVDNSSQIPYIEASIDGISPKLPDDENSRSLLPIVCREDLDLPWLLVFDLGVPKLYITNKNNLYKSLKDRTRSPWFYPIIMHQVFREIFVWLGNSDSFENEEKADKWRTLFVETYGCPKDFFDSMARQDLETRLEEVHAQSLLIAEKVVSKNLDLKKIELFFTSEQDGE